MNWNFFELTWYPPPCNVIEFSSTSLDMLEKIVFFFKFFHFFRQKVFVKNKFDKNRSFIKIVTEILYHFSILIEYFNKKSFLLKFFILWKIFLEKYKKILTKQFLSTYLKNIETTLLLQEKFFNLIPERAFYKVMNKNLKDVQNFQTFFHI